MKMVEIINSDNFVKYLRLTEDYRDTIILPPRGRLTKLINDAEFAKLQASGVTFRTI